MGDGVEELDRARAESAHSKPLAVGGDRQPIGLDANIVDHIDQLPRLSVDHGDGTEDRGGRHSKDRVLPFIDVTALAGDEELCSICAESTRARPVADAHLAQHLIGGDVYEGD